MQVDKVKSYSVKQFKRLYKNVDGKLIKKGFLGIGGKPVTDSLYITNKLGEEVGIAYTDGLISTVQKYRADGKTAFFKIINRRSDGSVHYLTQYAGIGPNDEGKTFLVKSLKTRLNDDTTRVIRNHVSNYGPNGMWCIGKEGQIVTDIKDNGSATRRVIKPSEGMAGILTKQIYEPIKKTVGCVTEYLINRK